MVKRAQLPPLEFHPVQLLPNQTTIKNNGHTGMYFDSIFPQLLFVHILRGSFVFDKFFSLDETKKNSIDRIISIGIIDVND